MELVYSPPVHRHIASPCCWTHVNDGGQSLILQSNHPVPLSACWGIWAECLKTPMWAGTICRTSFGANPSQLQFHFLLSYYIESRSPFSFSDIHDWSTLLLCQHSISLNRHLSMQIFCAVLLCTVRLYEGVEVAHQLLSKQPSLPHAFSFAVLVWSGQDRRVTCSF